MFFFFSFFYLDYRRGFYLGLIHVCPLEEFMGSRQMREREKRERWREKEFNDFLFIFKREFNDLMT